MNKRFTDLAQRAALVAVLLFVLVVLSFASLDSCQYLAPMGKCL